MEVKDAKFKPTFDAIRADVTGDRNTGFCIGCGCSDTGYEPDARGRTCNECGQPAVYGMEELLMAECFTYDEKGDDDDL